MLPIIVYGECMTRTEVQLLIAKAIYDSCYEAKPGVPRESVPSPGWAWERTSQPMRDFCLHQADCVMSALEGRGIRFWVD
jgi:hypothetical protein